jgi:hypothetical protein
MFFADVRTGDDTYYKRNGDSIQIHFPGDNKNNSANYPKLTVEDIAELYNELTINTKHNAIVFTGNVKGNVTTVLEIIREIGKLDCKCNFVIYTSFNNSEYEEEFEPNLISTIKELEMPLNKQVIVKIYNDDFDNAYERWFCKSLGLLLYADEYIRVYDAATNEGYIEKQTKENS